MTTAFPDMQATVEDVIAEHDKVVTRITLTGTPQGSAHGCASDRQAGEVMAIAINRFTNGKVAEIWCTVDMACLFSQIGALRSLPPHPRTSGPQRSESDALPRIPPRPHARACAPANSRRCRSSRCGLTCSKTAATRLRSTSTQPYSTRASFQALLTHPWAP